MYECGELCHWPNDRPTHWGSYKIVLHLYEMAGRNFAHGLDYLFKRLRWIFWLATYVTYLPTYLHRRGFCVVLQVFHVRNATTRSGRVVELKWINPSGMCQVWPLRCTGETDFTRIKYLWICMSIYDKYNKSQQLCRDDVEVLVSSIDFWAKLEPLAIGYQRLL